MCCGSDSLPKLTSCVEEMCGKRLTCVKVRESMHRVEGGVMWRVISGTGRRHTVEEGMPMWE